MYTLTVACLALAVLYAGMTFINLIFFRPPPHRSARANVSVLIPARDEAANIGPAVDAVLASEGVDLEVVVLDDGSTDGTGRIVAERAARDGRVRLIEGDGLPAGWNGKQHACWQLARAARRDTLVFIDADVRVGPDALGRLAAFMERRRLDLASGFPRQVTRTLGEQLVVNQILVLLLGYLPMAMARIFRSPGFAAGCGQLMAVRRDAYFRADGHRAIRASRHDGLMLPRTMRAAGGRTDLFDATSVASCRMYDGWEATWAGFSKNATEGMAKPVALPVWTVLLGGGHVLPVLLAPLALIFGPAEAVAPALLAVALVYAARAALAVRTRQPVRSVLLHPLGVAVVLAIQWAAFLNHRRGRPSEWRGRSYGA
ncbi:glycosyltransferase [Tranquillimonas alkanivorans]|uniref:Glycosyltransferase, catalytic subunit of cellulose synthase and poly-beta-1,6-N-acetylglucosamine synthase n=1 Tax=Tranquillimonas alkanivorans TaxID=441119 RepID=A0A1I5QS98_9RHOB|nr:glycosyltransferase family 2 protein [Tranquillimonas alkanivorans]SFP49125.1 Glycosyltransferase, catalytic subunit of cellulose synthase and poly-beta-1,6-N-acetylglucosamine synthase [Tranquillimonas alkanivorans]